MEEAGVRDRDNDCENVNAFAIFSVAIPKELLRTILVYLTFFRAIYFALIWKHFPASRHKLEYFPARFFLWIVVIDLLTSSVETTL